MHIICLCFFDIFSFLNCFFFYRHTAISNQQLHTSIRLLNSNDSSSSSDSSDSDNEKPEKSRQQSVSNENEGKSKQQTVDLLNSLLTKMSAVN